MPVILDKPGRLSEREIGTGLEHPFREAFRASRTAMLLTDPHGPDHPIAFANEAFRALTGYAPEEVVGCNCRFLQGPGTDRAAVRSLGEAIRAGEGVETEILNYRKDGTPFWNALSISPVRNGGGDLLYFFATCREVRRKEPREPEVGRIEEEIRRRTRDLQTELERTAALLHEIDHRSKNTLQVVSSLVLLKARRTQDTEARGALQGLAERISALSTVHRLLSPADGTGRLGLSDFIGDLLADLVASPPFARIDLAVDVEPAGISAGKAVPLALLVNELATNALRHAFPEGRSGRLSVSGRRSGSDLCLVVQDDGVGIAGGAPSEEGFGKTLIDMLVRQLRGTIAWDDTSPGTRVTLTMPLDEEESQS
jgi:PAS domain S-box-containing protein